jgi:hypothetical protein
MLTGALVAAAYVGVALIGAAAGVSFVVALGKVFQ